MIQHIPSSRQVYLDASPVSCFYVSGFGLGDFYIFGPMERSHWINIYAMKIWLCFASHLKKQTEYPKSRMHALLTSKPSVSTPKAGYANTGKGCKMHLF